MDLSTQMNHWIALTAELEDTREAIAKNIFKLYKANKIHNDFASEQCRKIDDLYKDAKKYELELAEDFKGYTDTDPKKQGGVASKAQGVAATLLSRMYIKQSVAAYKRNFKEQFMELGQKTINSLEDGISLCDEPQVLKLCRYALKLQKDGNERWEEIQILHRDSVRGSAFLGAVQQFFTNLAVWGRANGMPFMQKYLKIDDNVTHKLRDEYRKKFSGTKDGEAG